MLSTRFLQFGFGGYDAQGQKRPLPVTKELRLPVRPSDVELSHDGNMRINPDFVANVERRVFRQSRKAPGAVWISGLGPLFQNNMKAIRAFEMALGEGISRLRDARDATGRFGAKYMGRSNKAKLNPLHHDTQAQDAFVLMLYEPTRNIKAWPFFADTAQYAHDEGITPDDLLDKGAPVKSHYGHQFLPAHRDRLMADYSFDLADLDLSDVQLVAFNDSVRAGALGLGHGMRHLEIPNPDQPPERPFNHMVFDIPEHPAPDNTRLAYFKKGVPEAEQPGISAKAAGKDYVETGAIYYRKAIPHQGG